MVEMRNVYKILVKDPERKANLEDPAMDESIILKLMLRKKDLRVGTGFNWLMKGPNGRLL
jgi:hypothetical protein